MRLPFHLKGDRHAVFYSVYPDDPVGSGAVEVPRKTVSRDRMQSDAA